MPDHDRGSKLVTTTDSSVIGMRLHRRESGLAMIPLRKPVHPDADGFLARKEENIENGGEIISMFSIGRMMAQKFEHSPEITAGSDLGRRILSIFSKGASHGRP